jgi:Chaperone of endosialidase/Head domain of trimeric autotransporter adhesin
MEKIALGLILLFFANNIFAQNVGIGNAGPLMNLHITSTDSAVALLENTQNLSTNVSNSLYFKTGNGSFPYTGAIKTIGQGTTTARLGFYTYAAASANGLLERLSIVDNGNVGINTINPLAAFHVEKSHVLFTGPLVLPVNATAPPASGAGKRMFWYNDKAAFRTGSVSGTEWDQSNVGIYSFAAGINTKASGDAAIALGGGAEATADYSTAVGLNSIASGLYSTAIGKDVTASGVSSTAFGSSTTASGESSTAMGFLTDATQYSSTAIGNNATASGLFSTAIGTKVSTNGFRGSLILGDEGQTLLFSRTNCVRRDEFRARFDGGYTFLTNTNASTGVFMLNGANSWSTISDSTKKEQFLKTDGENVLNSISKMRLGSWNYKSQNSKNFRHYGPMAQEFYNAFGNDGIGKIGCDTLISAADIDGVMMIGLQALEKRSAALAVENKLLKANNIALQNDINFIKEEYVKKNKLLTDKMALLENKINEMLTIKENEAEANLVINK